MTRIKFVFLSIIMLFFTFAFWAEVDHFVVEVKPNPTKVNQANDLIIKAVDVEGNVVTDYEGDVLMTVTDSNWQDVTDNQDIVVLPDDGVATFTVDDEGVKTYSKWLIFKKSGTYTIEISDLTHEDISGQTKIQVNDEGGKKYSAKITIDSPINGSKESKLPIDVSATTDSPNSVYQIYVDGKKVKEWLTDQNGQINDNIDNVNPGEHSMYIKLLDVEGNEIWKSEEVHFSYQPPKSGDLFKKISIYPSNTVKVGEQVVFEVETDSSVNSAEIKIWDLWTFPMDKEGDGKFKLTLNMEQPWDYSIDVLLYANWQTKTYNNVANIEIKQVIAIKNVKIKPHPEQKQIEVSWDYTWDPKKFKVLYGLDKNNLNQFKIVDTNKAILTWIEKNKIYYIQIVPLDENWNVVWEASNVLEVSLDMKPSAPRCVVKDIKLKLKTVNGQHYIIWDKVDWVNKYIIYVADKPDGPFEKLGETTETKWEYPFDPDAKKVVYKYFKVEAVCSDGSTVQIDKVKKVKVWPAHTILLLLIVGMLIYSLMKLNLVYKD